MLKNGMAQEEIAQRLFEYGFRKIIYLPMKANSEYEYRARLHHAYQCILTGELAKMGQIPFYTASTKSRREDIKIIHSIGVDVCSFWCPISLLHVSEKFDYDPLSRNVHNRKNWEDAWSFYCGKTFAELSPYLKLYQEISENAVTIESLRDYLELVGRTGEDEAREWLDGRMRMFRVYEDAIRYDLTFFTNAPSPCVLSERGILYAKEGFHRITYFYFKGYEMAPVSLPKEDFENWMNQK